jgi:multiple sugar transport system ATP-binding protein
MGRAIVRNPKVFLFDEPLSNLDAKLRVQMRTEIKRVHQKVKTTTVYVTHDQVEAMTLADRVVVMNGGKIEQIGTPNDLYHHPKTRFVAGFIGSPAMNFIPGKIESNGSGLKIRLSD